MGRYVRLRDDRVHNKLVEKKPPEGLRNRASPDPVDHQAGKAKVDAEETKYCHLGGGKGRLSAAVQRAMALRERASTQVGDVKGIGAMRYVCNNPCSPPHNIHNTLSAAGPAEHWSAEEEARESNIIHSPLPEIGSRSMKYRLFFCSVPFADEDQYSLNKAPDLGNHCTCSLPQSHQVCEACNSLPLPERSANAAAKKKGLLKKLFRLHKTTISAPALLS